MNDELNEYKGKVGLWGWGLIVWWGMNFAPFAGLLILAIIWKMLKIRRKEIGE